jgi:hypothetical protein
VSEKFKERRDELIETFCCDSMDSTKPRASKSVFDDHKYPVAGAEINLFMHKDISRHKKCFRARAAARFIASFLCSRRR